MITIRAALLSACVLAAVSTLFMPEPAPAPAPAKRVRPSPAAMVSVPAGFGTQGLAAIPEQEWPESRDTTGLLDEQVDIDALVDELNADSGEGFEPVDREALTSLLQRDAGLREHYVRAP